MLIGRLKVVGLSAVIMMAAIVGLPSGLSLLMGAVTIHSSGSIGPVQPPVSYHATACSSEIRALFIHSASVSSNPDWKVIAQTAKDYGINTLIIEALSNYQTMYPSAYVPGSAVDNLANLLAAAHTRDITVHVLMDVQLGSPGSEYQCERADGSLVNWLSPTKEVSRTLLKNLVEELTSNYDIDGFMFDYIRYDTIETAGAMCYSMESKAKLEEYLGETITSWPADFAPGGSRYNEFMEWRVLSISELVRDMRAWMLAIKPDLEFSAAVWGWWPGTPTFNRWRLGQDFVEWVKEGYLDWVAPMMYSTDTDLMAEAIQDYHQYGVGGPEGVVPLVAFLTNAFPATVDPANFREQIETVRANGADGWAIWRYGGPGDNSGAPDIRQYLDLIDLYPRFSVENVTALPGKNNCEITWTTDMPASSKVEYSTSPLFTASFDLHPAETVGGISIPPFHYWDIDHAPGTIVEDTTPVTVHSVILTDLQEGTKYYFRVQSEDQSSIATSKDYVFTTLA